MSDYYLDLIERENNLLALLYEEHLYLESVKNG